MKAKAKLTKAQIVEARGLYQTGSSVLGLARRFEVSADVMSRAVVPGYAARRAEQARQWRRANKADRANTLTNTGRRQPVRSNTKHSADFAHDIPQDRRDLTARLMGDPLPGRSALDRAKQ